VVVKGELYKGSISGILQRGVTPQEGKIILKEIHAGICGHHASSRAIAAKAFRAGLYWLTSVQDAKDIVRHREACQRFTSRLHALSAELQPIPLAWPFAQWSLDMVRKLHKSWLGGHVYLLVVVKKFTKWIEVAPVITQDSTTIVNFIKSIVFRFGVPNSIITDNDTNFTSKEFKDYCKGLASNYTLHLWRTRKQRASRKGQWPDMQWHQEKVDGPTQKSQTCLGTRITLCALKFTHNAKCGKLKRHLSFWSTMLKPFFQSK
jgi:hypothetical protein